VDTAIFTAAAVKARVGQGLKTIHLFVHRRNHNLIIYIVLLSITDRNLSCQETTMPHQDKRKEKGFGAREAVLQSSPGL
jgi:hypothetical protein